MCRGWKVFIIALLVLILAAASIFLMTTFPAGHVRGEMVIGGVTRSYLVYVPKSYQPGQPTPLVLSIHGFASWPQNQMELSQWNEVADRQGFIMVYPSGTGFPKRWATGGFSGQGGSPEIEVEFISSLIDRISSQYSIDPKRIYATGLSNGGGMSYLLACRLSQRIAAIGTVAGAYVEPPGGCSPARPLPVIAFHGTADPIVPYLGGAVERSGYRLPVIADWVKAWAQRNACTQTQTLPQAGSVSAVKYTACTQNADVVFYTVSGGGHTWPGGGWLPEIITGKTTQDVDATALMWEFFTKHPLK